MGTIFPWVELEFVVIDVVFLVVGLPSVVHARFGFQDLAFGDLNYMLYFILHGLMISFCLSFPLCSFISLQSSTVLASLVALLFAMFSTPGLDNVFLCVCSMGLEGCFCSQTWALFFAGMDALHNF
ncbi:hypothetical protein HID58_065952 [Brassica napus]|uniref:Uncharacterized protein n=1 Tax=Brassica napus TaxID=3708 RepID=A0ABQ7ZEN9_BRANA|nr:hypothetical protein HID58_065952 [Brassica napus]